MTAGVNVQTTFHGRHYLEVLFNKFNLSLIIN